MVNVIQGNRDNTDYESGVIGGVHIHNNKNDGWTNLMMGLNKKGSDKTGYTTFSGIPQFTDRELSEMYAAEGMAKRIIDLPAKDSVRAWIDADEKLLKRLKELKAKQAFRKALSWARLYRGSIIVMVFKGDVDLEKPLSSNPKELEGLRVYSAAKIEITTTDIVDEPSSKWFDEIEVFPVRLKNGTGIKIHASRCLIFRGEEAPDEETLDFKYRYWGMPTIMKIYDRLKDWGSIEKSMVTTLLEFNIGKFTLENLAEMLMQQGDAGLQKIYDRMGIINASKSNINSVLLGKNEAYERDTASVAGVAELMDRYQICLSAVSDIPVTRLWGRSPAGENATGESDMRQYYDDVSAMQETEVEPPLTRLIEIIGKQENVSDTSFVWNPLWQPTAKEMADTDKINMETDTGYIGSGVRTPEEVHNERFPDEDFTEPLIPPEGVVLDSDDKPKPKKKKIFGNR